PPIGRPRTAGRKEAAKVDNSGAVVRIALINVGVPALGAIVMYVLGGTYAMWSFLLGMAGIVRVVKLPPLLDGAASGPSSGSGGVGPGAGPGDGPGGRDPSPAATRHPPGCRRRARGGSSCRGRVPLRSC